MLFLLNHYSSLKIYCIFCIMPKLVSTKQLKAARALAGLTQDQLGAAMGLNGRMVRFWERRIPTNPRKLARHLWQRGLSYLPNLLSGPCLGRRKTDKIYFRRSMRVCATAFRISINRVTSIRGRQDA